MYLNNNKTRYLTEIYFLIRRFLVS